VEEGRGGYTQTQKTYKFIEHTNKYPHTKAEKAKTAQAEKVEILEHKYTYFGLLTHILDDDELHQLLFI
jgi:hypothetical protein